MRREIMELWIQKKWTGVPVLADPCSLVTGTPAYLEAQHASYMKTLL